MKKLKGIIVSLTAVLLALIVLLFAFILPNKTACKEQRIVKKYVEYIDKGKVAKAVKLTAGSALANEVVGNYAGGLAGSFATDFLGLDAFGSSNAISVSMFRELLGLVPEDAYQVEGIRLIGTSKFEPYELVETEENPFSFGLEELGLDSYLPVGSIEAVVALDYINSMGQKESIYKTYTIEFTKVGRKSYIVTY